MHRLSGAAVWQRCTTHRSHDTGGVAPRGGIGGGEPLHKQGLRLLGWQVGGVTRLCLAVQARALICADSGAGLRLCAPQHSVAASVGGRLVAAAGAAAGAGAKRRGLCARHFCLGLRSEAFAGEGVLARDLARCKSASGALRPAK